jgi:hypothetical protein
MENSSNNKIMNQIESLELNLLGSKIKPPEGY